MLTHLYAPLLAALVTLPSFTLWITFAAGAGPLPGQDEREVIWKAVEKQERLELRWRRDAQGNFEYAVAAEKDPEWQPWFSKGFARAFGVIGACGQLALFGHSGDVLSLTDGERHLQRLGMSLTTGDLVAFARTPLPEAARDVALLDRMVAIDVLRARSDADAKVLVTQLGADATLPKGLRERASATVARLALDPEKWPLPAAADAFVVVRQAKMPSARYLLELGRFSCLVASAKVLTVLKQPTQKDFVHGETASEVCAEIPFEIARHLGNYRLDETGFTIRLHEDGTSPEWTMCGVGHFDTAAVGATAPELGITFDSLSDTTITVRSQGLAVASRPDFGKQLLANGDAAVLVHVPKGSSLVAYGEEFGVPGIVQADLAVTLREADVLFDLRLGAADAAAAKTLADAIKKKLSELGWPGFLHNFAIAVDESLLRVEPDAEIVRVTFPLRRAAFPSLERAKQRLLEQSLHAAPFSLAPLVHAQAPAGPSVEWIRSHAIPFSTSEAGNGFDDLAGLENVIGDARIVALGEPTHGTREAFQMKHRLLEYLVERHGFSIFSIEANMPEADAFDAYVNGGEGDPRQLIAGYGWTGDTEEYLAMVEWMRAWNVAHPERPRLRFTGFDMQSPTAAARIAAQFLRKHAPHMEQSAVLLEDLPARGEVNFTTATGAFPVEVARGKELVVSVWIRTEIPNGWAGLWWRCDTPRGTGAFDNMQSRGIIGISDWTRYETRLTIDDDVQNINFGCLLAGEGTAWFDDIEITLDGKPFVDPTFGFGFEEGTGSFVLPQGTPRGAGCTVRWVDKSPHGGERCLEIQRKPEPDAGLVKDAEGVLADMLAHRDEFARMTSAREADWAIQNARVVAQWARMTCAEYPSGLNSGVRDECMAENVAWILEQNPGTRAVLWAHNGHVSRAEFRGITPMGGHLGRRFPDQMVVFGFSTGRGTYTALARRGIFDVRSDNPLQPPPEDSIESYLASAGLPRFLLDIRAARDDPSASWAIVPHPMRHIGARAIDQQFFPCVVRDAFDVLVWQAETTASVPIRH